MGKERWIIKTDTQQFDYTVHILCRGCTNQERLKKRGEIWKKRMKKKINRPGRPDPIIWYYDDDDCNDD